MPREDENSTDANAPKISSQPDRSLGDGVTGGDFANAAKNVDRSLGDQSTSGDASSSVSDLSSAFDGADEGMELIDLSSRYDVRGTLGRGGMGDVVLAYDKRIKRQVAIKRILGELAASRRAFQRFLTEAQSVGALSHPNIVQVIDFGRDREGPFLILEYVDGGTLLQKLEAGPLPVAEAVRLCCQILDGLAVAHSQGIIHRDIKPANILLTSRGDAKLTDFGLARQEQADTGLTSKGAILGTFDYMPPEQRKDAALTDSRSDLWSLAATLYQMLTGEPPRVIDLDALPPQLRPIVSIALKPKKEDRYQTASEFRDALLASERQQATDTGKLREGECAKCHAVNATDRKFCKECGASLVEPCLSCQSPVSVWEKFCGSCGKNAADGVEAYRQKLKQESEQVRYLSQNYRYDEALALLEKMAAIQDHRFDDFTQWAKSSLQPVTDDSVSKRDEVLSLFTAAEEAAEQYQYKDAAKFLSQIPEQLLNDQSKQLQALVVTRSERLKVLSEEIKTAVKAKQFDGLLPKVEEYLSLKPTDGNAHKLAERLRSKALMQAALVVDEPRSFPLELPTSKQPGKKTTIQMQLFAIAAACCVVVVVVGMYALTKPKGVTRQIDVTAQASPKSPEAGNSKLALSVAQNTNTAVPSNELDTANLQSERMASAGGKPESDAGQSVNEPPLAIAPFDALQATNHQQNWAAQIGSPVEIENSIGMKLTLIPVGEFTMGSSAADMKVAMWADSSFNEDYAKDEQPQHRVKISKPFYMGVYEVTQWEYENVMETNPSQFSKTGASESAVSGLETTRFPVENVSWFDAVEFCNKLSEKDGLHAYYTLSNVERTDGSIKSATVSTTGRNGYRLPTEAEWEYACRAGSETLWHTGNTVGALNKAGWWEGNSEKRTNRVGQKTKNAFGLYDMHGNVLEWCFDVYDESVYRNRSRTTLDPLVTSGSADRVLRGGSWGAIAWYSRTADRGRIAPDLRYFSVGFRVVVR